MNAIKIVTGAGPVGWTVASQLAEAGEQVRVLTRSGSGPDHPRIEKMRVDVSDPQALRAAIAGADARWAASTYRSARTTGWSLRAANASTAAASGSDDTNSTE